MKLAVSQVWFGWDSDYKAAREQLLERSIDTVRPADAERFAKLICLNPVEDEQLRQLALRFARQAVDEGASSSSLPWFQLALGMAEYRNEHYPAAHRALDASAQVIQSTYSPDLIHSAAGFYRAMTLFREGKEEDARRVYGETETIMPPFPEDELNPMKNGADHDYLIIWLAYKEAGAMLGEANPKSK